MQKFHTLWNGIWEPEDITPEYVQSLSIPDALLFMYRAIASATPGAFGKDVDALSR